jgi:23S rRNA (pseudouridine1915-N3)-methyltransferase
MRWIIATVGTPKLAYAKLGVEDYAGRLRRMTRLEFTSVKAAPNPAAESAALLARTENSHRIVLDSRGEMLSSAAWAALVGDLELAGTGAAAILIGGAEGHSPAMHAAADRKISLGPLTLQHELALVVLLEQLYRAYTILRGLPYHRE